MRTVHTGIATHFVDEHKVSFWKCQAARISVKNDRYDFLVANMVSDAGGHGIERSLMGEHF
jgi:hypothetical protein